MTDPAPPQTPAGWYPEGANGVRYWDGTAWTDNRAPATPTHPPTRGRNYPGDIALALTIVGAVLTVVFRFLPIGLPLTGIGLTVAFVALGAAGTTKRRGTAIVALVLGGIVAVILAVSVVTYLQQT